MEPPRPGTGFFLDGEPHVDPAALVAHFCATRGIEVADIGVRPVVLATFSRRLTAFLAETAGAQPEPVLTEWKGDGFSAGGLLIVSFPIGAPAAIAMVEELYACGMRTLVVAGSAGSLQESTPVGTIVVPDSAIREEGTSHHYAPEDVEATPDAALADELAAAVEARRIACQRGINWTTDAIYREHRQKVDLYRRAGVLSVDMEMSALFTVAAYRGVRCAAIVAISDELHGETWEMGFGGEAFTGAMTKAGRIALTVAQRHAGIAQEA